MGRLRAAESLDLIHSLLLGGGHIKPHTARSELSTLQRRAEPTAKRRRGLRATPEILQGMGINIAVGNAPV